MTHDQQKSFHEVRYSIGLRDARAWCSCGAWSTTGYNEMDVVEAGECHERTSNVSDDDE